MALQVTFVNSNVLFKFSPIFQKTEVINLKLSVDKKPWVSRVLNVKRDILAGSHLFVEIETDKDRRTLVNLMEATNSDDITLQMLVTNVKGDVLLDEVCFCSKESIADNLDLAMNGDVISDPTPPVKTFANTETKVNTIAFYLPQFHPFPENDEWWGKGFTEWNNVVSATPQYEGHNMPLLPADLGFYDIRLPQTLQEQGKLANEYGIDGFCYYYYWFSGRRIMQDGLNAILNSGNPDMPFCLCWANESWSRRWDGSETEILIKQEHDPEIDKSLVYDLIEFIKDSRYIKVNNKPMVLVYRLDIMRDTHAVFNQWRQIAMDAGFDGLHIVGVRSFGITNVHEYGCDAAVDFPPHRVSAAEIQNKLPNVSKAFEGKIYNYEDVVISEMARGKEGEILYPGVMPRWDNTARKSNKSHIFHGATPRLFKQWLKFAFKKTQQNRASEKFVFINSWNEWAEGAHLEPDNQFGHLWLTALRDAKIEFETDAPKSTEDMEMELKALAHHIDIFSDFDTATVQPRTKIAGFDPSDACHSSATVACHMDYICGRPGNEVQIMPLGRRITIGGWSVADKDDADISNQATLAVRLIEKASLPHKSFLRIGRKSQDLTSYWLPVIDRHPRDDVATFYHLDTASNKLGFRLVFDTVDIKAGEYDIEVWARHKNSLSFSKAVSSIKLY